MVCRLGKGEHAPSGMESLENELEEYERKQEKVGRRGRGSEKEDVEEVLGRESEVVEEDLATIFFTSGEYRISLSCMKICVL